jgi:hypothetical protein
MTDNLNRSGWALLAQAGVVLFTPEGGIAGDGRLRVVAAGERITL